MAAGSTRSSQPDGTENGRRMPGGRDGRRLQGRMVFEEVAVRRCQGGRVGYERFPYSASGTEAARSASGAARGGLPCGRKPGVPPTERLRESLRT